MNNRMTDTPETPQKFPTPAEIEAAQRVDVTPEVNAALATIKAHLLKSGPGTITGMDWPSPAARAEIERVLRESGWNVRWRSEQREGTWVEVTAMAVRKITDEQWLKVSAVEWRR